MNTKIRRWQTIARDGSVVNNPEHGVGVLRVRPSGHTLLYEKGYVRPPLDVLQLVPEFTHKVYRRLWQARLWGDKNAPPNSAQPFVGVPIADQTPRTDIAEGLHSVVRATQFATTTFGLGLIMTLIAVFLDGNPQTVLQYLATLGFVLAWAAISSGVYQRRTEWLTGTCLKSARWWATIFVPVCVINLFFTVANSHG